VWGPWVSWILELRLQTHCCFKPSAQLRWNGTGTAVRRSCALCCLKNHLTLRLYINKHIDLVQDTRLGPPSDWCTHVFNEGVYLKYQCRNVGHCLCHLCHTLDKYVCPNYGTMFMTLDPGLGA
jgi:hypothetical protein